MVDHELRCIFIHQRKAAGTSIITSFGINPRQPEWHAFNHGVLADDWNDQIRNGPLADYFIFSVVRNPFDRVISGWKNIKSMRKKELVDVLRDPPREGRDYRHFTLSQSALLLDRERGQLVTHDLIRFETLQQDFDRVCDRIGKPRVQLPRLNQSRRWRSYRWYFNRETRQIVEAMFREDLERFGYEF
jgi:hypothetical protein